MGERADVARTGKKLGRQKGGGTARHGDRRAPTFVGENFGIARSRLSAEGFGQTRRFAYNTTLEGQQENRRVNIIINYGK